MTHRPTIPALLLPLLCCGCVHTYPGQSPDDPTLLNVSLLLNLSTERPTIYTSARSSYALHRFIIVMSRNGKTVFSKTFHISDSEATAGNISLEIPQTLEPKTYSVFVWSDLADPSTLLPLHYDADNLSEISMTSDLSSITLPECHSHTSEINLAEYSGAWNNSIEIPITLTSPVCMVRFEASDLEEFLRLHPEGATNSKEYSATITFSSPTPLHFNATGGTPLHYVQGQSFPTSLFFPDTSANVLHTIPIFAEDSPSSATATVSIYNSARVVISRTTDIPVPLEAGKTSVISGDLLTNYLSKPIVIDNQWENEIIVDLTSNPEITDPK